jgi:hypothetical protein
MAESKRDVLASLFLVYILRKSIQLLDLDLFLFIRSKWNSVVQKITASYDVLFFSFLPNQDQNID